MRISVVVPLLNEQQLLPSFLAHIRSFTIDQLILVDGGSLDQSLQIAQAFAQDHDHCECLSVVGGRHQQLNAALEKAWGDIIVCCPVDVRLSSDAMHALSEAVQQGFHYGCFYQRSASLTAVFAFQDLLARMRARWAANAYMDQVPYFTKSLAQRAGGFRAVGSYDTAELFRRIAKPYHFCLLPVVAVSSCRAWRGRFLKQVWQHQCSRLRYLLFNR